MSEYLTIQADLEMIEQVLINLLKNAIEALAKPKTHSLTLLEDTTRIAVKIEVIDNGSGIIKEAVEHIFVPFYTTKRTGSGIGLSLSRQIMQMHNGFIGGIRARCADYVYNEVLIFSTRRTLFI